MGLLILKILAVWLLAGGLVVLVLTWPPRLDDSQEGKGLDL